MEAQETTPNNDPNGGGATTSAEASLPNGKWGGLKQRIITSVLILAVVATALMVNQFTFNALILLAAMLMHDEWVRLASDKPFSWRVGGYFYVLLPTLSLLALRNMEFIGFELDGGLRIVLYLILLIAATDIGAYFAGRQIGGPKLAPAISPGKTWAGLGGGMVAAAAASVFAQLFTPYPQTMIVAIFVGLFVAVAAQAGDLFESWVKRQAGVKDSGSLFPGHGGILDRVDGYTFAAPLLLILVLLFAERI